MKANFKRLLSAVAALAMTATCMSAATMPVMFASAEVINGNIASYATVSTNTTRVYGDNTNDYDLTYVTDGNTSSKWQAHDDEKNLGQVTLTLDFGTVASVTSIAITSNGIVTSSANEKNDHIRVDSTKIAYNDGTTDVTITEGYEETAVPTGFAVEGNTWSYTFAEATNVKSITYTFTEFNSYCPIVYEVEVQGTIDTLGVVLGELQAAIDATATLVETDYTAASWATLQTALADANAALASEDEAVITGATTALNEAIDGLELDAATKLADAVAAGEAAVTDANEYKFTAESVAALDGYLAEAATYTTIDSTNIDAVNACIANIYAAIEGLASANLAVNATPVLGSNQGNHPANLINDADHSTRWASDTSCATVGEKITLNFGATTTFNLVDIYWENERPSAEKVTIQYSNDGVIWNDVANVAFEGDYDNKVSGTDYFFTTYSFDAVKAQYVRAYVIGATNHGGNTKEKMSVFEFEVYNTTGSELAEDTAVEAFEMKGAQVRENAEDATLYDLRFVVNFAAELYADIESETITDLGVVLTKIGATDDATRTVSTKYLRNVDIDKYGMYTYTVTITGIADIDQEWGCEAYYTTEEGTVTTAQIVRTVAQGL